MNSNFTQVFSALFIIFLLLNHINLFELTVVAVIGSIFIALIEAAIPSAILYIIYRFAVKSTT
ncbi:hypothetical protein J2755_000536 [Methanohalophilus levihalophilus]|nr:hypothetical protein [Methanohalophilus levihalophilus]